MPDMITSPGDQPSPQHVAAVAAIASSLLVSLHSNGVPHAVMLDGLLSAYASMLLQYPCCWEPAANGIHLLADKVLQMHADKQAAEKAAERAATDAIATAAGKAV